MIGDRVLNPEGVSQNYFENFMLPCRIVLFNQDSKGRMIRWMAKEHDQGL